MLADLTTLDGAALAWFLLAWLGYSPLIRAFRTAGSINARMDRMRRGWMHAMLGRDNRITDASLIGHTVNSAAFFASTTILALAALLGLLGNGHVLVDDADATALGHGHGHAGLGHRVHGGGDERDMQGDLARQPGSGVGLGGEDGGVGRQEQHVVEGVGLGDADGFGEIESHGGGGPFVRGRDLGGFL